MTSREDWINMDAPIQWGTPVDRSEIKPPYPMWCPACETVHLEGQHTAVPDA